MSIDTEESIKIMMRCNLTFNDLVRNKQYCAAVIFGNGICTDKVDELMSAIANERCDRYADPIVIAIRHCLTLDRLRSDSQYCAAMIFGNGMYTNEVDRLITRIMSA